jgi:hypothetical protein
MATKLTSRDVGAWAMAVEALRDMAPETIASMLASMAIAMGVTDLLRARLGMAPHEGVLMFRNSTTPPSGLPRGAGT